MAEKFITKEEFELIIQIYQVGLIFLNSTTKNDKLASEKGINVMPKLLFALLPHTENEQEKRDKEQL